MCRALHHCQRPEGLRWWVAYVCTHARVHKSLVILLGLAGAVSGLLVSEGTPKVYCAQVVFRVNQNQIDGGIDATRPPWPVLLLRAMDDTAVRLKLPDPHLGERLSNLLEEKR